MQYHETIVMETVTCCNCGMTFAMPERYKRKLVEEGGSFYCPAGHAQHFADPEVPRLKKEIEAAKRKAGQFESWYKAEQSDHQHTRDRLRATKGVLTKTKKRIAHGVCPCCQRTFADLQRHMHGQHPDYVAEAGQAEE